MAQAGSILAALRDPSGTLLALMGFAGVAGSVHVAGRLIVGLCIGLLRRRRRHAPGVVLLRRHGWRRRAGAAGHAAARRAPALPGLWGIVVLLALAVGYGAMSARDLGRPTRTARREMPARLLVGTVTHVRDGDTIEVNGLPVRFARLDCAERGTLAGRRATRRMRELADGQPVRCPLTGARSYDRRIGSCRLSDGRDLAREMAAGGLCRMR